MVGVTLLARPQGHSVNSREVAKGRMTGALGGQFNGWNLRQFVCIHAEHG